MSRWVIGLAIDQIKLQNDYSYSLNKIETPPLAKYTWPWQHPLISERSTRDQRALLQTESCLKCQEWSPYKAKGVYSRPDCGRGQNNGSPDIDQGFSTASCHNHHVVSPSGWHHPPPLVPPFLLAQNLSSKRIVPTDKMRPNFDNDCSCH